MFGPIGAALTAGVGALEAIAVAFPNAVAARSLALPTGVRSAGRTQHVASRGVTILVDTRV